MLVNVKVDSNLKLFAPVHVILERLRDRGIITRKKVRPSNVALLSNCTDKDIVLYFASVARALLYCYRSYHNFGQVKALIDYQIRWSAIFTLAKKHKISARQIIMKYSKNLKITDVYENILVQYIDMRELNAMRSPPKRLLKKRRPSDSL